MLRQALAMRKPQARGSIRSATAKLEREIEALTARRRLAMQAMRGADFGPAGGAGASAAAAFAQLDAQIARRMRQISDLAALLRAPAPSGKAVDEGATAEAAVRPASVDPVTMLHGKGKLNDDQVRAAREIAWVHEAMTRAGRARVSRLSQIDPPAGWSDVPLPERAAFLHAKRFRPWAERLRRAAPASFDIVFRVAVLGISVYAVARSHRVGWNRCVARLAEGLDLYWRGGEE
jgi:hypothetical protein